MKKRIKGIKDKSTKEKKVQKDKKALKKRDK